MTTNLRISLGILATGFGIEGGGELYSFLSHGAYRPGLSLLFVLPVAMTLAGLLFVWVGQHEWNELHRARIRSAHRVFALSLVGAVVAGAVVAALVEFPETGTPLWARIAFGAAAGSLVLGTFVTYALLVFHLVARPSRAALLASVAWALVVAGLFGGTLAASLGQIVALAAQRSFTVPNFLGPVSGLSSYLFVSYFLLLVVYLDAHRTVAKGKVVDPEVAGPASEPRAARVAPGDEPDPSGTGTASEGALGPRARTAPAPSTDPSDRR